ncbi:hypothetical protein [uncultured Duncaniella sp.]|uniref:hypothetical protein n=1 Tax=uncultured Duncaniella sp. TaxID=2768039 RepID=UPI00272C763C|nr:hypothetical protein [uncultured Duncaniella sp.]
MDAQTMLNSATVSDAAVEITVQTIDGKTMNIRLKDAEDFPNEVVAEGTFVNLVYASGKIFSGFFDSVEDEDGELAIYLTSKPGNKFGSVFPFKHLIGYYTNG